jgi:hypothetical protein
MRPEEFSQMLRQRPGAIDQKSQEPRDLAKDKLRASMETFAVDRREAKEQLEQSRKERLARIWQEAGEALAQEQAQASAGAASAAAPLAEAPAQDVPSEASAGSGQAEAPPGFVFEQTQDKEA